MCYRFSVNKDACVTCVSEFVLFNNVIILVLLSGKTAKLLLSITIWVEETKDRLILVTGLHSAVCEIRNSVSKSTEAKR